MAECLRSSFTSLFLGPDGSAAPTRKIREQESHLCSPRRSQGSKTWDRSPRVGKASRVSSTGLLGTDSRHEIFFRAPGKTDLRGSLLGLVHGLVDVFQEAAQSECAAGIEPGHTNAER